MEDIELGTTYEHQHSGSPAGDKPANDGKIKNKPHRDDESFSEMGGAEETQKIADPPPNMPSTLATVLSVLAVTILTLLPAALIWLSGRFERYNLLEIKPHQGGTNNEMEFVRVSLVTWAAMVSFLVIEWLVAMLPSITVVVMSLLNHSPSMRTKRRLSYFLAARTWFTLLFWVMALGAIGSLLVYKNSLLQTVTSGLTSAAPAKAAAAVANIKPVRNQWFYLERLLLVMIVFSICQAAAKYLIELIAINFHRMAFESRVTHLNYCFEVVTRLYTALNNPGKRIKLGERVLAVHLVDDHHGHLASEKQALELANDLYQKLAPSNRDYLTMENFRDHFEPADLEPAFKVFDKAGNGDVALNEVKDVVINLHHERICVSKSITNNNLIISKLDMVFMAVSLFLTFTFAIPIFDVGASAVFVIFGLVWTSFGFLFQSTAKNCYESFLFVFIEHAYDVGDRVIIDGEFLTVERVEIFTTVFRRWDNTAVYIPNCNLAGKSIQNIRRSGCQSDFIDVVFSGKTSIDVLWLLRDKLVDFAKSDSKDYTGFVEISNFDLDGDKIKVQLTVQYRSNFQEPALRATRRNKFIAILKQSIADLDIEYFL